MRLFIAALASICFFASAQSEQPDFYSDKQRGWFWHETEPEQPEETEYQQNNTVNSEKSEERVTLDVDWLRKNLDGIRDDAINKPTPENLAAYAYAQRLMLDLSTRFSSKMMEFMEIETLLDESKRRPTTSMALASFSHETRNALTNIMDKVKENNHVWFFYKTTCSYCMKQIPVLKEFSYRYGVKILAISMDGGTLPGMEDFDVVYDNSGNVTKQFNVTVTPTMFVAQNDGKRFIPLTQGLHTLPEIEKRLLLVSRDAEIITTEEYQRAQSVREVNVFKNSDGEITANKERLENDPGHLADLLRAKLKGVANFGSTPNQPSENQD
jgi:conjugal transfer pilus assembly protein TraF